METIQEIRTAGEAFSKEIAQIRTLEEVEALRIRYLGKKGLVSHFMKDLREASIEIRQELGKQINDLKGTVTQEIASLRDKIQNERYEESLQKEKLDVSLPGKNHHIGTTHPLQIVQDEILDIFNQMGFLTVEGPEIETDYYNFEALNIPADHPARDIQDSFYLPGGKLLRTQTSPVQIRTMEKFPPPVAIVSPGRVFRRDTSDASHSPIFHQVEGLYVNREINFSHLKGLLHLFSGSFFGETHTRFRPDYFPFTEPSCDMSIECMLCHGRGCSTCGGDGWIEILGAGLVNPIVLKNVGVDPEVYSGLAFGLGIERIAMLKYGIEDIRKFYENNDKFLRQFPG